MDGKIDLTVIEQKLKEAIANKAKGVAGIKKSEEMVVTLRQKITEMYAAIYHIEGMIEAYESLLPPKTEEPKNG